MSDQTDFEIVVGLEIHIQLKTESKLFAPDPNIFGAEPNQNVSYITTGYPGVLPKINKTAIEMAVKMGLATNCAISPYCYFDRKNYNYPDLPKGFQTTQDNLPICTKGWLNVEVDGQQKKVQINRIHMEEDAGKSIHDQHPTMSEIDLNRAGTPLLELVTEPDIRSGEEARTFVAAVRQIAQYIGVSDGNMQEGSLRCDANVSLRLKGTNVLNNRVEIKNVNSLRNIKRAIEHEAANQIKLMQQGQTVLQQTKGFDAKTGTTFVQRSKEMAFDYRYFPEPDLMPIEVNEEWLNEIKTRLPQLPKAAQKELQNEYNLSEYQAKVISAEKEMVDYFKAVAKKNNNYPAIANWLSGAIKSYLNEKNSTISSLPLSPESLADLIQAVDEKTLSNSVASSKLLPALLNDANLTVDYAIKSLNLRQSSNADEIEQIINSVLESNTDKVAAFKKGRKGLLGFFVGSVMKQMKAADPALVNKILTDKLNE